MKLSFRALGLTLSEDVREFVTKKVGRALGSFGGTVRDVTVSFRDINGPRGGEDIACRIDARVRGGGFLTVEEIRDTPFAAAARASERFRRRVRRSIDRRRQRRRRGSLAALGLAFALSGCASVRVSSQSELAEPETLDSYAWIDELNDASPPVRGSFDAQVRTAVELQLSQLGLDPAPVEQASVLVSYATSVDTKERNNDPYFDYLSRERYELGTLAIRLHDPRTLNVVWEGRGQSELRLVAVQLGPIPNRLVDVEREPNWRIPTKVAAILGRLGRDLGREMDPG